MRFAEIDFLTCQKVSLQGCRGDSTYSERCAVSEEQDSTHRRERSMFNTRLVRSSALFSAFEIVMRTCRLSVDNCCSNAC